MKGISLPINTMIIIVLASIVLAVLLFFFVSTSTPAMEIVKLQQEKATRCYSYQQYNTECNSAGHSNAPDELVSALVETCKKLNTHEKRYPSCASGDAMSCALQCCCTTTCLGSGQACVDNSDCCSGVCTSSDVDPGKFCQ